jgi:hypothetical protein
MALQPFVGPWLFFQFLDLCTVGRTPWTGDQPVARPPPAHRTTQTQNKSTQISMPWVGFEPTILVFERAKTVYAIDRASTMVYRTTWKSQNVARNEAVTFKFHWVQSALGHVPNYCYVSSIVSRCISTTCSEWHYMVVHCFPFVVLNKQYSYLRVYPSWRIFVFKRGETWDNFVMRKFVIYILQQILHEWWNSVKWFRKKINAYEREVCIENLVEKLERDGFGHWGTGKKIKLN